MTDEIRRSQHAQPSLKLQRLVIELLQANFLEKEGRYYEGWSDQQIASNTGVSIQVVKLIRREAFGELLDDDPEVAGLKASLEATKRLATEYKAMVDSEIASLQSKFDTYIQTKRKQK